MSTPRAYGGVSADDRRAERRERLMDAAYTLLTEQGAAALTVTGVCSAARLTARYFYEHFDNRDALLLALVEEETVRVMDGILVAAQSAEGEPLERARAAVAALVQAIEDDPRRLRMAQAEDEFVMRMRQVVADRMIERMVEQGQVVWPQAAEHPERMRIASALVVGGLLQLVSDWAAGGTGAGRDEVVEAGARFAIRTGDAVLS